MKKCSGVVSRSFRASRRTVAAGLVAVVAAAGLIAVGDVGTAGAAGNFYVPPSKYDATPGSVIRSQHTDLMLQIPGVKGQWPGTAKRIMYTSTLQNGEPTAVTGIVVEPTAKWKGKGERPTLVIGHGTIGQGDQCAGSKIMNFPLKVDVTKPSLGVNYTAPEMYLMLLNGVRVVLTDYAGMGTPGVHSFLNRVETGHAMLDAARAGLKVAKAPKDAPVAFSGYSQGGGAAASAAELAQTYASDLNVKATYAGAPSADVSKVMNKLEGTLIAGAIGYVVNGLAARYPELAPVLKKELNKQGKRALHDTATQCIPDSILAFGFARTNQWTRTGEPLASVIKRYPKVQKMVDDQRIGSLKPNAPVLLSTAVNDDVVSTGQVVTLAKDWRKQGADVTLTRDYTPPIFPGLVVNHGIPMVFKLLPATNFLLTEFNR
ncbi:lipase family protein [Gordonia sp. HY002]|uniref:lipase family protein n=1 Tax=Gordonia zhenghanii TaxID=2911516 RepID=UPI001EF14C60|nr:lipase family protein [Gordonia zhenghanii]MCF8569182.1 lipase family protein [Gordonia zhenghanii]MCF8604570.1 lipase family protein [Gordonia zhenghanii]